MRRLLFVALLLVSSNAFSSETPMDRWAKAAGGRERLAAVKGVYREGILQFGGMEGSIKVWHWAEGKYRKEEQIGPYSTIETFDGTTATLQRGNAAPQTLTGADLAVARSKSYANSNAMFFVFFPERHRGTLTADGETAIVFKPEGGIEWRITLDPQTSLPKTMVHEEGGRTINVELASYETVDGITLEKEIHRNGGAVIRFTKTVINPPPDPSGHWTGTIHAPEKDITLELDLARNAKGDLAGTFSNAAEHLRGLPLADLTAKGATIGFEIKGNPGTAFEGALAADGTSISGNLHIGGMAMPVTFTRTGEAKVETAPASPAMGKELEGTWNGTLDVNGTEKTVGLTLTNRPDGTAVGVIVDSGLQIPIARMLQKGSSITLDVTSVGGSYAGTLNAAGTELAGTWTQGNFVAPLTFRRAAAK